MGAGRWPGPSPAEPVALPCDPLRPALLADGLRRAARAQVCRLTRQRGAPVRAGRDRAGGARLPPQLLRLRAGCVSVDYLGEDVTDAAAGRRDRAAYLSLLSTLARPRASRRAGVRPLEVSVKLSALGQALPATGEKIALENARTICERPQRAACG